MQDGLTLLIIGMGTVLAFLVLLVVLMRISSAILQRFFPDAPVAEPVVAPRVHLPEIAAAVAAARAHLST